MENSFMKSIGILWNSMNNFRESAFEDIREYAKIGYLIHKRYKIILDEELSTTRGAL